MERFEIVIVGSGPAGISTALSLHKIAPKLAARTVVLERARHPRPKVCGGGVTIVADPAMRWLDVGWDRLALFHAAIDELRLRFEEKEVVLRLPERFRIVQRNEFDARLAAIARDRGIAVWEETPVTGLRRSEGGVIVQTPGGEIDARVVVGADGAGSRVRR